jgi:hypothetical protein
MDAAAYDSLVVSMSPLHFIQQVRDSALRVARATTRLGA